MALVIGQTLPYAPADLKLDDPHRWSRLLPLIRPSVKAVELEGGQTVVIDTALVDSKEVLIAVVARLGSIPNRILSDSLAAFAIASNEKDTVTSPELDKLLLDQGFPTGNGVVIIRAGAQQDEVKLVSDKTVEVTVRGEVKLDHVLSLLFASNRETKASLDNTLALLEHFIKAVVQTTSSFQESKTRSLPTVAHASGAIEFTSAKTAIEKDLGHLLSSQPASIGESVYSVHFSDLNGFSKLENNIFAHEIAEYLSKRNLPSYITQSTIMENHPAARGWAISLSQIPTRNITAQAGPSSGGDETSVEDKTTNEVERAPAPPHAPLPFFVHDRTNAQIRNVIVAGCENLIRAEPDITVYDTIVGDGDCGHTLRQGATQALEVIYGTNLTQLHMALHDLVEDLENTMGGTSGALYCIFLTALAHELCDGTTTFPKALKGALVHLLKYTKARLGDRTVLDCLIPFTDTLLQTDDVDLALAEAAKGTESTKKMEAMMGRSSYLDQTAINGVPDPGAYGLLKLLEGMVGAFKLEPPTWKHGAGN